MKETANTRDRIGPFVMLSYHHRALCNWPATLQRIIKCNQSRKAATIFHSAHASKKKKQATESILSDNNKIITQ